MDGELVALAAVIGVSVVAVGIWGWQLARAAYQQQATRRRLFRLVAQDGRARKGSENREDFGARRRARAGAEGGRDHSRAHRRQARRAL